MTTSSSSSSSLLSPSTAKPRRGGNGRTACAAGAPPCRLPLLLLVLLWWRGGAAPRAVRDEDLRGGAGRGKSGMAVRWRVEGGDGARVVGRGGERRWWRWGGESEGAVTQMRREFGTSDKGGV
jgi:hypothetical protein